MSVLWDFLSWLLRDTPLDPAPLSRQAAEKPAAPAMQSKAPWSFVVNVEADELDGGWVAEAPDFPGAMAQGETQEEAVRAIVPVVLDIIALRMDRQAVSIEPQDKTDHGPRRVALSV